MKILHSNIEGLGELSDESGSLFSQKKELNLDEEWDKIKLDDHSKGKKGEKVTAQKQRESSTQKKEYNSTTAAILDGGKKVEELVFNWEKKEGHLKKEKGQEERFKQEFTSFLKGVEQEQYNPFKEIVSIKKMKKESERREGHKEGATKKGEKVGRLVLGSVSQAELKKEEKRRVDKNQRIKETSLDGQVQKQQVQKNIEKYSLNYMENVINPKKKKKEEVEKLRDILNKEGVSTKEIKAVEGKVQNFIKKELKKQVKKDFIEATMFFDKKMVQEGKVTKELYESYKRYQQTATVAKQQGAVDDRELEIEQIKESAREELRYFISDELDRQLVETKLKDTTDKKLAEVFDRLSSLAGNANFDAVSYTQLLRKKMEDFGLNQFISPYYLGIIDSEHNPSQDQKKEEKSHVNEEMNDKETEAILSELYARKWAERSWLKQLKIKKQIEKYEKNCPDQERLKTIQEDAKKRAIIRFKEQLKESLKQSAALIGGQMVDARLIRKEIKKAIEGLKKCGVDLSQKKLRGYKDQANREMFTLLKEEYLNVCVYLKSNPQSIALENQANQLFEKLQQLKEQSNIKEDITPQLFSQNSLKKVNVNEAA